jgi:hypothetical protein
VSAAENADPRSVSSLSVQERVSETLRRSLPLLPGEARDVVAGLLSPESVAIIAGTMALWAGSHLFGVGEIIDLLLLAVGGLVLGRSIWGVAEDLWEFARLSINGSSESDLDQAANTSRVPSSSAAST